MSSKRFICSHATFVMVALQKKGGDVIRLICRYLKEKGIRIATAVTGLIIPATSIEMMTHGVSSIFGPKIC